MLLHRLEYIDLGKGSTIDRPAIPSIPSFITRFITSHLVPGSTWYKCIMQHCITMHEIPLAIAAGGSHSQHSGSPGEPGGSGSPNAYLRMHQLLYFERNGAVHNTHYSHHAQPLLCVPIKRLERLKSSLPKAARGPLSLLQPSHTILQVRELDLQQYIRPIGVSMRVLNYELLSRLPGPFSPQDSKVGVDLRIKSGSTVPGSLVYCIL